MTRAICLTFCTVLLLLDACATDFHPTPYWMMHESQFRALVAGKTTRDDVLRQIGIPWMDSYFPRQKEEVLEYRYLDASTTRMLAYVYFDANGIYKYSYRIPASAFYGGGGHNR